MALVPRCLPILLRPRVNECSRTEHKRLTRVQEDDALEQVSGGGGLVSVVLGARQGRAGDVAFYRLVPGWGVEAVDDCYVAEVEERGGEGGFLGGD